MPWNITISKQSWVTAAWALVPSVAFWLEYFWFAPNLAKIADNLGKAKAADAEVQMDRMKNKLGQLNDFRGVSVPIWAAVLTVLAALYANNVKIQDKIEAKQAVTSTPTPAGIWCRVLCSDEIMSNKLY